MNTIIRRVLAFILSFALIFATTARANATTSVGGWSALDTVTAGATNTINAAKTAGGKALKSAVTIAPQAGKVGKYLLRGGAAGALALAVPQLIGDGVDWVLDPANNSVRYKDPNAGTGDGSVPTGDYLYAPHHVRNDKYGTSEAACTIGYKKFYESIGYSGVVAVYVPDNQCRITHSTGGATQDIIVSANPNAGGDAGTGTDEYKSIPIDVVAAKVISNAEAGHAPSQEAVKATALEGFAAGEHDAALDAAATETGTENPPDTENPPKDGEPAPFDPAGIISAINALKALLAGILSSITSLSDFFQSEPPPEPKPEDTELDIPVPDVVPVDTDINFGGSCPANFEFNGSIFGNPINIVLLDTSKFCGFLSTFVKFPVYAASSLFALYILGGRKDG